MPTLPLPLIWKWVALDDPTMNSGTFVPRLVGLMEKNPNGVEVPTPTRPVFVTTNAVVVAKLLVVDEMRKRFCAFDVEAAKTERRELSDEVAPIATLPPLSMAK